MACWGVSGLLESAWVMQMAVFGGSTWPGQGIPSIRLIYHPGSLHRKWLVNPHLWGQAQPQMPSKGEWVYRKDRKAGTFILGWEGSGERLKKPDISRAYCLLYTYLMVAKLLSSESASMDRKPRPPAWARVELSQWHVMREECGLKQNGQDAKDSHFHLA